MHVSKENVFHLKLQCIEMKARTKSKTKILIKILALFAQAIDNEEHSMRFGCCSCLYVFLSFSNQIAFKHKAIRYKIEQREFKLNFPTLHSFSSKMFMLFVVNLHFFH